MFKKTTLKNGLRIVTVPDRKSKAVTVLVLIGTGSKYEKKETNGISHLLEHLLFKGTKKKPTSTDVIEPLDSIGGAYNAFTSEECTGYFAKVGSEHFEMALETISDIYLNSKLDSKEIKKEKSVIIEEINMYQDHPASYVQVLWNKVLYGDQPAGWDVAGTKEGVTKISRQEIIDYINHQYTASNTVVCIAGNIEKEKDVINKVKKYFSGIKTKDSFEKIKVVENQRQPECLLYQKSTDQTHFCLGVRGYEALHPKRYIQEVLSVLLGGMMSSRLFIKIREEMGLAYYIRTNSSSDTDTGFLVSQTGVDNKKVEQAISAILKEYKKVSQKLVSPKELKKAKENLKGKMTLLLETSDAQASFYGLQEVLHNETHTPEEIYDKIEEVSSKDILDTAKDIFKLENLNLAIIGPFKDKEKFQKLLKI
ncbi:MAG: pitrilysin family protein [Candidatus Nealsonbacteria bacterium]